MARSGALPGPARHLMQGTFPISSLRPRQDPGHVYAFVTRSFSLNRHSRFVLTTSTSSPLSRFIINQRSFSSSSQSKMSLQRTLVSEGNNTDYPKVGDNVTMQYTGWLYEAGKPQDRGKQFDSSVGRGDFKTKIGVGQVIKGWDEGVPQMSLGETSVLTIPGHMAYGKSGYPGLIPPNATLIFEVKLLAINSKRA